MNNVDVNEYLREHLEKKEVKKVANDLGVMVYTEPTLSDGRLDSMLKYIEKNYREVYDQLIEKCDETQFKRFTQNGKIAVNNLNDDIFADAVFALKNNFCSERIEDVRILGKYLYAQKESAENNKDDAVPVAKTSERKAVGQQKGTRPVGEQRRSPQKKKISGGLVLILGVAVLVVIAIVIGIMVSQ